MQSLTPRLIQTAFLPSVRARVLVGTHGLHSQAAADINAGPLSGVRILDLTRVLAVWLQVDQSALVGCC